MSADRAKQVFIASLAEQAERYQDMVAAMKNVAGFGQDLSVEERNLLSVGYKNLTGSLRASWRIVASVEKKEAGNSGPEAEANLAEIKAYRHKLEAELKAQCDDLLGLIKAHLIPQAAGGEARVFYYKMEGDYHRYVAEFASKDDRKEAAENSLIAYKAASDVALTELPPTHPIRLGLALNFSVFYYEILDSPDRACQLAKQAFDDAVLELETLNEEAYNDSTLIMQLLRDNLALWTQDKGGAEAQAK